MLQYLAKCIVNFIGAPYILCMFISKDKNTSSYTYIIFLFTGAGLLVLIFYFQCVVNLFTSSNIPLVSFVWFNDIYLF